MTFEEGEDSALIHVVPLKDGLIEGPETIRLIIENTLGCIVRYDTVEFTIIDYVDMVTQISPNTMICEGQQIELWVNTFNGIPPYTFDWEGLAINNDTISVSPDTTTWFFVNVLDLCLDTVSDSVKVTVFPLPDVDIGPDSVIICEGDSLLLNAGSGFLGTMWQNGSNDSTFLVTDEGFYFVIVTGPGGCTNSDSIYVTQSVLDIDIGADTTICIGESITFNAGEGYSGYLWQDGSTDPSYVASQTGTYWVKVTNGSCTDYDSVYLFVDDPTVSMNLGNDTTICMGDYLVLKPAFGVYNSYLWSTGETTPTISVSVPGTYTLTVESGCGMATDQITIGNWPYPDPALGLICNFVMNQLCLSVFWIQFVYTGRIIGTFPFYTVSQSGEYWCDVTDIHGCSGTDTVSVSVANVVSLGENSLNLCTGDTLTLDAGNEFDYYTWYSYDGNDSTILASGISSIEITTGGKYSVYVNYYFGCESMDYVNITEYPVADAFITGDSEFLYRSHRYTFLSRRQ